MVYGVCCWALVRSYYNWLVTCQSPCLCSDLNTTDFPGTNTDKENNNIHVLEVWFFFFGKNMTGFPRELFLWRFLAFIISPSRTAFSLQTLPFAVVFNLYFQHPNTLPRWSVSARLAIILIVKHLFRILDGYLAAASCRQDHRKKGLAIRYQVGAGAH